jgi:hypothetical protein
MINISGSSSAAFDMISVISVSARTKTPLPLTPRRSARILIWRSDSSPET